MPIVIENLGFRFGSRVLFDNFSCELREGQITGFVGPSGSGKSTLLAVLAGAERPQSGTVTYPASLRRGRSVLQERIAWMTQTAPLMLRRSALANVSIPLHGRGVERGRRSGIAMASLELMDMEHFADESCIRLSGGERQRVAMARAVASEVALLLADEPTSALDKANRARLLTSLRAVAGRGTIVVVATHDLAVVSACDEVVDLEHRALASRDNSIS